MRWDQHLTKGLLKSKIRRIQKFEFLSSGSSCFFSCFPRVFLSIDPRDSMGGLIEKAGSACEESEDNDGVILG